FTEIAEATAAMVFIVQGDEIRYANGAAQASGGLKRSDLVGSLLSDLAHPDSREGLKLRLSSDPLPGALLPQRFELKLTGPPGSELWVDLTLSPIMFEGVSSRLAIGFDITDRKMAESAMRESERRLRDLIENVQLVSVLLDATGEVTFANEYAL